MNPSWGNVFMLFLGWMSRSGTSLHVTENGTLEIGESLSLICNTKSPLSPYWTKQGDSVFLVTPSPQTTDPEFESGEPVFSVLTFNHISLEDFGNYTCHADKLHVNHALRFKTEYKLETSGPDMRRVEGSEVTLSCSVVGFPLNEKFIWFHVMREVLNSSSQGLIKNYSNMTSTYSTLRLENVSQEQNGSYSCRYGDLISKIELTVLSPPVVDFAVIKAIGKHRIFLNWTTFDGNSPILELGLTYFEADSRPKSQSLSINISNVILKNLHPRTNYSSFTLVAKSAHGSGNATSFVVVTTLDHDPSFIPTVTVKGYTSNSVTVGWADESPEFFHRYSVHIKGKNGVEWNNEFHENPYLIDKLQPGSDYVIKISACSNFTFKCDAYSNEVNATTMDGISSAPLNLAVQCFYNQSTHSSLITARWNPPQNPQGLVVEYSVALFGNVSYRGQVGLYITEEVTSIERTVTNTFIEFRDQPPNTMYYFSVCAKTKIRICGEVASGGCTMPPSIPNREELSKVNWRTVVWKKQFYFMITMPYISQRNGSVCCFRIVVVRLNEPHSFDKLGSPGHMKLSSYDQVHNSSIGGAYVAELLDPNVQTTRNIMIGDEVPGREASRLSCENCFHSFSTDSNQQGANGNFRRAQNFHRNSHPPPKQHRKRHASSTSNNSPILAVYDGPLHPESTYTAYLDAVVISEGNEQVVAHSKYFSPLRPTIATSSEEWTSLGSLVIGILLVAMVSVILAIMCVMRWRRKEPGDEEYGLSHSLQQLCRRLRGQQWVPSENTVEIPPIPRDRIIAEFIERHKEGDSGFQQEFENLPDRFSDRSCHESDKRENVGKNRYPDIKAYDQTRVRLSVSDGGSHTSDYINANFVVGYKERKKFICAQGPMEATVVDWWRLVWEQRVTLILMLTNTEEYNKTKCAKYWPSPAEGSSVYGEITVTHNSEKEFSDYLVRNLQLKRSRPSEQGDEEREVHQYHYLVWKDFMAPEYPIGIIRFIKRFNEIYSPEKGPILVHCSAGVGRTGTLVALDSLLEQLIEENSVSIFNTICDLRHQRNFLVQSLKQYIFIYRALMEASQFGDTEVKISDFKTALERLKGCDDGKLTSRMEEEFEKLSQVIEDRKPFSVGASDENRHRNRHGNVIPYDRCRVILSPMPNSSNETCTYINGSFIEGYDNTEQFIKTQDPLENTIGDFWRMIVEQNVRTIVMLSEVGEESCPRYWPEKDQETSHDYIKVKYMQSQSFPFYYKREFTVTNSKQEDSYLVTQFQYNGWPVGTGEVPESTRGLVELVDTTLKHQESIDISTGPSVVHCSDGAQRSCIFVALAILVKQMMTESRVDVFSVVRKLRSQRQNLFQNAAQYELVYRGLLTYSELHMANGVEISKQ